MNTPRFEDHPTHFQAIRQAALQSADAERAVRRNLQLEPSAVVIGPRRLELHPAARFWLVGLGKAAPGMIRGAAAALGGRVQAGLATVARHGPHGTQAADAGQPPERIRFIPAEHPTPGLGSLRAGRAAAELLAQTNRHDLVIVLVSGGGSALMELPLPGIRLGELQALTVQLLASGAPIGQINRVRRALSQIKAGGLARLAWPAQAVGLILSDVVGDRLSLVASGPTVLGGSSPAAARQILQQLGLWRAMPDSIRRGLRSAAGPRGRARRPFNLLVGSNRQMLDAAGQAATILGFQVHRLTDRMQGEARQVGARFASRLRSAAAGSCLLMGGESTVNVRGAGLGGRNQELALAAGLALDGALGRALMAWASDGVDGPTDAAGAVVHAGLAADCRVRGLDPQAALVDNNAYPLLQSLGALIRTGPTGTNLNDLVVGLAYASN